MNETASMTASVREFWQLIRETARTHCLDPFTVAAVVSRESEGNPWVMRREPDYPYLFDRETRQAVRRKDVNSQTFPGGPVEMLGQTQSWGLMQVMGAIAREMGHEGRFSSLLDSATNFEIGCRFPAQLQARWGEFDGLAAYHVGHPSIAGEPRRPTHRSSSVPPSGRLVAHPVSEADLAHGEIRTQS